jgi:putative transposase
MKRTRGNPYRPVTQGKIEYYHRSMNNQIPLEISITLKQRLTEFLEYYNLRRLSRSLNNLNPAALYFGRGQG